MTNEVLFSVLDNGLASITLNRPEAIHSLSYQMVKEIGTVLKKWETDDRVQVVVIKGLVNEAYVLAVI